MSRINHSKLNNKLKAKSSGVSIGQRKRKAGSYRKGKNDHLATDSQKKYMMSLGIEFEEDISKVRARLLIFNALEERSKKI